MPDEGRGYPIYDDLAKLAPPDLGRQVACLKSGWVGPSEREGYSRLYIGRPELTEWLEFRDDDCLYQVPLDRDKSTLGGSLLWFKEGTRFGYTSTSPRSAQLTFLKGEIRREASANIEVALQPPVAFTGLPCTIVISLLACTIFDTCHHVAAGDCTDPPDK
jgi:hypothetical protein